MFCYGNGPTDAKIMLVGEYPGEQEAYSGVPFSGRSGQDLTSMLHDAGIIRRDCYCTNVLRMRPHHGDIENMYAATKKEAEENFLQQWHGRYPLPELLDGVFDLYTEIDEVRPNLIIAMGDTALWAITGKEGITNWRGSVMSSLPINGRTYKVVPTFNPAMVSRMWEWRPIAVHDFTRAAKEQHTPGYTFPAWNYTIRPSFEQVSQTLTMIENMLDAGPKRLACDIETRKYTISCIGFAWSRLDAICIPLQCVERQNYWSLDEEVAILERVRGILTHPNAEIVGQNFHYDTQYFAKELGIKVIPKFDTMVAQHTLWPGMQKALYFIASMYCEFYQYWKDDGKEWTTDMPEEQHWRYNCMDCTYTYESHEHLEKLLVEFEKTEQFEFQMRLFWPMLKMMLRGVLQDPKLRAQYLMQCLDDMAKRQGLLEELLGHSLNPRSPQQLNALFYIDFAQPVIKHKKTRRPTCDDDALEIIAQREPLLKPVVEELNAYRSLGQFVGALKARIDPDQRMRCSFNMCGAETFRWSSSTSAFGTGTNLQNVSTGARRPELNLPNVRRCFRADPGKILLEPDLAGADAQVVAWEAGDEKLKAAFRAGLKIHAVNAKDLFGANAGPDGRREPYYTRTKVGVHLTNYGGRARTCATALGITVHEAERFQRRWFDIHPEIVDWHDRVRDQLLTRRYVENRFGYRRYYFSRIETAFTEALAWVPQSTVALTINRGLVNIDDNLRWVEILLQVHDSLLLQIPKYLFPDHLPTIRKALLNPIPYEDPLTIQTGLKVSDTSWGDVEDYKWPD